MNKAQIVSAVTHGKQGLARDHREQVHKIAAAELRLPFAAEPQDSFLIPKDVGLEHVIHTPSISTSSNANAGTAPIQSRQSRLPIPRSCRARAMIC